MHHRPPYCGPTTTHIVSEDVGPAGAPSQILAYGGQGALPPLTVLRAFTSWSFTPSLAAVVLAVAAVYGYAVYRLRQRGDRWPGTRSFCFIGLGLGSVVVATQSSMETYDTTLFSVHMVQHMVLSMVVPVFLALGAPVTLALRVLPRRPRKWLTAVLHNGVVKVLAFPAVSLPLFAGSMFGLYFTPWYEATLRNTFLHDMQHVHFVLVGCLFFWPLVGVDPVPGRLPHLARMGVAFLAVPTHAVLGITLMTMDTVIASGWYLHDHQVAWVNALADQNAGGAILWASGDLVNMIIAAALFAQWVQADERQATRVDRRLDRHQARAHHPAGAAQAAGQAAARGGTPGSAQPGTPSPAGDDELAAYNAWLARLNRQDSHSPR